MGGCRNKSGMTGWFFRRHCERSEAIQSDALGPGLPRRYAPRNDEDQGADTPGLIWDAIEARFARL